MDSPHLTISFYGSVKLSYVHIYILFVLWFLSLGQWPLMSAEGIFCPLLS
jgi:hypothetical protein